MQIQKIKALIKNNTIPVIITTITSFFVINKLQQKHIKSEYENLAYNNSIIVIDRKPSTEMLFSKIIDTEDENDLPKELRYNDVNELALKQILEGRNSILIEEPYFSTIISVSKNLNVHPLLMFAVLGQEQGFVPKTNSFALEIANNPFNVFGSWQKYNTDIKDSSEIAARTLINLSMDRPYGEDPIKWINSRGGKGGYAEDENWWLGVKSIFEKLKQETN